LDTSINQAIILVTPMSQITDAKSDEVTEWNDEDENPILSRQVNTKQKSKAVKSVFKNTSDAFKF
jgi:hypothetical protein